jgi:hypothetical protein
LIKERELQRIENRLPKRPHQEGYMGNDTSFTGAGDNYNFAYAKPQNQGKIKGYRAPIANEYARIYKSRFD